MLVPSSLRLPAPVNQGVRLFANTDRLHPLGHSATGKFLRIMSTNFCKRCGQTYEYGGGMPLVLLMQIGKLKPEERAAFIAHDQHVPIEQAEAWLHHNLHCLCPKLTAYCPVCGGELRTHLAQWCPHCNHDWHPKPPEIHP